jgi:hypothetical protein
LGLRATSRFYARQQLRLENGLLPASLEAGQVLSSGYTGGPAGAGLILSRIKINYEKIKAHRYLLDNKDICRNRFVPDAGRKRGDEFLHLAVAASGSPYLDILFREMKNTKNIAVAAGPETVVVVTLEPRLLDQINGIIPFVENRNVFNLYVRSEFVALSVVRASPEKLRRIFPDLQAFQTAVEVPDIDQLQARVKEECPDSEDLLSQIKVSLRNGAQAIAEQINFNRFMVKHYSGDAHQKSLEVLQGQIDVTEKKIESIELSLKEVGGK